MMFYPHRPDAPCDAARGLAILRVVVGVWFLKAVVTKVGLAWAGGALPYPIVSARFIAVHARRVGEFAAGNPLPWYRDFLESVVLPHAATFATLQAAGEIAVGVGLVLGLGTPVAALVGLVLSVNYGLATQWMSFGQQGFHVLLVTAMAVFLLTHAGRVWGLDGLLARRATAPALLRTLAGLAAVAVSTAALPALAAAEPRLFVSNERSNDVSVIDPATRAVVATIPVGRRPRGIAASPDGRHVFVAESDSETVSVIDAVQLRVVTSRPAGRDPEGLAITPDGRRLFVTNENAQGVTVLDAASLATLASLPAGTEPEMAVVSADGRRVAVSNETSNDVYLIDAAAGVVTGRVTVPRNPRGMRFTADSRYLWVASEQAHAVSLVDVEAGVVTRSGPTGGSRPVDVQLSPAEDRVYVSHGDSGDIRVMDTRTLEVVGVVRVGPRAWWTALSPDGRFIYVTVGRANEVAVVDTGTLTVTARIRAGILPWGITLVDVPVAAAAR